ncbi:hypothetical protein AB0K16_20435 [Nonomuraea jabiensis]|uniref:hypothetical protein n=1 Tax=Nonomuraea jabiensis TaxID=882448 RepID=UPI00342B3793
MATLATGMLCDRIGLRRTMVWAGAAVAVLAVPSLVLAAGGLAGGFAGGALIGACKGLLAIPTLVAMSQLFPAGVRVTAVVAHLSAGVFRKQITAAAQAS